MKYNIVKSNYIDETNKFGYGNDYYNKIYKIPSLNKFDYLSNLNRSKKEKYKEYELNMKKVENLKDKFILIQIYTGFGNKLFDCIIGIYLKYRFGYDVYYVYTETHHTKKGDPPIYEIFKNLNSQFIFINENEGDYIRFYLKHKSLYVKAKTIDDLPKFFKDKQIRLSATSLYNLVFKMYDTFDKEKRSFFKINEELISQDISSYAKTSYATIHIRYGDKLGLAIKKEPSDNKNFIMFPIYTPEYYLEQIKQIKKLKIPIVILTDSYDTIKHFLLEKYNLDNDPDIFLPDINFIDSFYLIMYSSYVVMSHSTFSYGAYLLSKDLFTDKKRVYNFCTAPEFFTIYRPVDLFISKEWNIIKNKEYILNFNQEKVKMMAEYKKNNN